MVQGTYSKPKQSNLKTKKSTSGSQYTKKLHNNAKLGNPLQLPKNNNIYLNEALTSRLLSKEINKASEQKVAAKLIQVGGKITTNDIKMRGKELSKELRKNEVKKKIGRVEAKLNNLIDIEENGKTFK